MGVLILSEAEPRAREIAEYASKADNWYRHAVSDWVAGDRPEYVLRSGTVKAVFTWTMDPDGRLYRHMSVSSSGKLPHPYIVWTLAHYFGLTGAELGEGNVVLEAPSHWMVHHSKEQGCIMVLEEIKDDRSREAPSPGG